MFLQNKTKFKRHVYTQHKGKIYDLKKQFYLLIVSFVIKIVLLWLKRIILMLLTHLVMMLIKSLFQKHIGILLAKWNNSKNTTQKDKKKLCFRHCKNYFMKIDMVPVNQ